MAQRERPVATRQEDEGEEEAEEDDDEDEVGPQRAHEVHEREQAHEEQEEGVGGVEAGRGEPRGWVRGWGVGPVGVEGGRQRAAEREPETTFRKC